MKLDRIDLSMAFRKRWKFGFGEEPTEPMILGIINNSIRLQKGAIYFLERGRKYKRLAFFWHPQREVVISVDSFNLVAVSLFYRQMWKNSQNQSQTGVEPKPEPAGPDRPDVPGCLR